MAEPAEKEFELKLVTLTKHFLEAPKALGPGTDVLRAFVASVISNPQRFRTLVEVEEELVGSSKMPDPASAHSSEVLKAASICAIKHKRRKSRIDTSSNLATSFTPSDNPPKELHLAIPRGLTAVLSAPGGLESRESLDGSRHGGLQKSKSCKGLRETGGKPRTASVSEISSRNSRRNPFNKDPWTQVSDWNWDDDKCDEFVPHLFKPRVCKICNREINKHRRNAVLQGRHVLKAIEAGGGATLILPKKGKLGPLFLGGHKAVKASTFKRMGITYVVTAAHGLDKVFNTFAHRKKDSEKKGAVFCDLAWHDNSKQALLPEDIKRAVLFIAAGRSQGHGVLLHCAAGQSRSSTICTAYLAASKGMGINKAIGFIKRRRPIANPNPGFRKKLNDFDKSGFFKSLEAEIAAAADGKFPGF